MINLPFLFLLFYWNLSFLNLTLVHHYWIAYLDWIDIYILHFISLKCVKIQRNSCFKLWFECCLITIFTQQLFTDKFVHLAHHLFHVIMYIFLEIPFWQHRTSTQFFSVFEIYNLYELLQSLIIIVSVLHCASINSFSHLILF